MKIAIVTLDGFNELDSLVAAHILNRVPRPGGKAEITPTLSITSMNGVVMAAQRPLEFLEEVDAVIFGSGRKTRQARSGNRKSTFHGPFARWLSTLR